MTICLFKFVQLSNSEEALIQKGEGMYKFLILCILVINTSLSPVSANEKTTEKKSDDQMIMGKMNMHQMHSMMSNCMKMHNDSEMCNQEMMKECEKQFSSKECVKMMNKMNHKKE